LGLFGLERLLDPELDEEDDDDLELREDLELPDL
jgi:hypothetical protein